jgi:hypothetical protein
MSSMTRLHDNQLVMVTVSRLFLEPTLLEQLERRRFPLGRTSASNTKGEQL